MWHGGNVVIEGVKFVFYDAHSKTFIRNHFRMYHGDNFVIRGKKNNDSFPW